MIGRSVAGVLEAQLLFFVAGTGVLWALRGWRTWAEFVRLAGVAYLLGVAIVCVEATLVLVGGGGVPTSTVLTLSLGTAFLFAGYALFQRRPLPHSGGFTRPRFTLLGIAGFVGFAVTLALLVALFRLARVNGMTAYDAWAFWIPKAKAIYFFGGLDETLFRTLWGPSYPLLVPTMQAMDFHLMGSADQAALAVQYWFLFVGFVAAVAGLLRPRVPAYVVWPFLALAAAMPELEKRMLNPQADWPLDIFFVVGALCVALWLLTEEGWLLGTYGIMIAAALATKREGQLLAACLLIPALAVTWRSARHAWPRLIGISVAAYVVNIPWRIWWESRNLAPDTPSGGVGGLSEHVSRVGPGLRIVLDLVFDYGMWLLVVPIAIAAAAALLARRDVALPVLYLGTVVLAIVGFTWIIWAFPLLELNTSQGGTPIPRAVGSIVLLSVTLSPLLLNQLMRDGPRGENEAKAESAAQPVGAPIFRRSASTVARSTRNVDAVGSERSE